MVCSAFHVPPYKIGVGPMPSYNNIQALNVEYYSQALQVLIESAELAMDEGLRTGEGLGVEFDVSDLLRMDTDTQVKTSKEAVSAGIMTPNEARQRLNLRPVQGGETPWLAAAELADGAAGRAHAADVGQSQSGAGRYAGAGR